LLRGIDVEEQAVPQGALASKETLIMFNFVIPSEAKSPFLWAILRSRGTCFCVF